MNNPLYGKLPHTKKTLQTPFNALFNKTIICTQFILTSFILAHQSSIRENFERKKKYLKNLKKRFTEHAQQVQHFSHTQF